MSSSAFSSVSKATLSERPGDLPVGAEAPMLSLLRDETRALHRKLESGCRIWEALSSPIGYRGLITKMFGIYSALEGQLQMVDGLEAVLPDLSLRWKTKWLNADMSVLGIDATIRPLPADAPAIKSLGAAFGCFYVLEGSTLGGQLISREVAQKLGFTQEMGCRFFSSYGTDVGAMWKRFGQSLESFAANDEVAERQIVEGAIATFGCFIRGFGAAN